MSLILLIHPWKAIGKEKQILPKMKRLKNKGIQKTWFLILLKQSTFRWVLYTVGSMNCAVSPHHCSVGTLMVEKKGRTSEESQGNQPCFHSPGARTIVQSHPSIWCLCDDVTFVYVTSALFLSRDFISYQKSHKFC